VIRVRHLGRVPYGEALDLQRALQRGPDEYVVVLEHPPVYTAGARTDPAHVLVPVASLGADLVEVDRGGDVTFHGPGQVVCYPIVTVPDGPGAGRAHVAMLEEAAIEVVAASLGAGCAVDRLEGHPGVWVTAPGRQPAKVAAIGVRTTRLDDGRRRTLHGVALNVDVDLGWFARIVPCGIATYPVTSLRELGATAELDEVADRLAPRRPGATWSEPPSTAGAWRRARHPSGCGCSAAPAWTSTPASRSRTASPRGCGCPCAWARSTSRSRR